MFKPLYALPFLVLLAACNETTVPTSPPELTQAPDVATSGFLTAYTEQTVPMNVTQLRNFMDEMPLIGFLRPTENISNPVETQVIQGTWPEPGATRWVRLADGHYVVERVVTNAPEVFRYQIFIFTNDVGRGVEQIVGEQRFVPVDGGTALQWTYNILPKNIVTRQVVRGNIPEIEGYLSDGLARFADAARSAAGS